MSDGFLYSRTLPKSVFTVFIIAIYHHPSYKILLSLLIIFFSQGNVNKPLEKFWRFTKISFAFRPL